MQQQPEVNKCARIGQLFNYLQIESKFKTSNKIFGQFFNYFQIEGKFKTGNKIFGQLFNYLQIEGKFKTGNKISGQFFLHPAKNLSEKGMETSNLV